MLTKFIDLAEYVWDFYSPKSDLYPITVSYTHLTLPTIYSV